MRKVITICLGIAIIFEGCLEKKKEIKVIKMKLKGVNEDQELVEAVKENNLDKVIEALRKGANPNAKLKGKNIIHLAAGEDNLSIIRELVNKGADIKARTKAGKTVLHIACRYGYTGVAEYILTFFNKKDIDIVDKNGWTALMIASMNGKLNILELLINEGEDIEAKDRYGWTALMLAIMIGPDSVIELLIRMGANIEAKEIFGKTALMIASERGRLTVIEKLIKAGANMDNVDECGSTALIRAVKAERLESIKLLYKNSANINIKDTWGRTAIGMLGYLAVEKDGYRPLFLSIINHELIILRRLLQKRVDNISIKVKKELKMMNKKVEKTESLKILMMVMECDKLIRDEIFKKVVETTRLNRYIIENPELRIDESIFDKILKHKKIKKVDYYSSREIISLFIIGEVDDCKEQKFSEKKLEHKESETSAWCVIA